MNRTRAVCTLMILWMVTACGAPLAAQSTPTPLPARSTITPGPAIPSLPPASDGPPDLTVQVRTSVAPPVCFGPHSRAGAMVTVTNAGQGDSGPFMVEVNGILQAVPGRLKAGESRDLWFDGNAFDTPWAQMDVIVDPAQQVTESDEANNTASQPVMTLTPPLPCPTTTPVPMITPAS